MSLEQNKALVRRFVDQGSAVPAQSGHAGKSCSAPTSLTTAA